MTTEPERSIESEIKLIAGKRKLAAEKELAAGAPLTLKRGQALGLSAEGIRGLSASNVAKISKKASERSALGNVLAGGASATRAGIELSKYVMPTIVTIIAIVLLAGPTSGAIIQLLSLENYWYWIGGLAIAIVLWRNR